jgi:DNA-binding MarR family transcriptional regulator
MSRGGTPHPAHSFSGHPKRSASQEQGVRGPDTCPDDGELDLDPMASQRHDWPLPPSPSGGQAELTAVDLAEALLSTTHAFKQWGNFCFSHAEPELSKLSIPRAALLAAVVDVAPGRVRMGDLSSALGVTPRNITTIVDGLEREGLLARRPDPSDRRAIWLELTPLGLSHIERVHQLEQDISARFFQPLDAEQRQQLAEILTTLSARDRFQVGDWCDISEGAASHPAAPHRQLRGRNRRLADRTLDR